MAAVALTFQKRECEADLRSRQRFADRHNRESVDDEEAHFLQLMMDGASELC